MKRKIVGKFATGQPIPEGAIYLWSTLNGVMSKENNYQFVWHYFLIEVE